MMDRSVDPALLSVLIVDDHQIMREGLERILRDADARWRVHAAGNGFDGLRILARERIDLVIVDLVMPDMNGLDLIRRIHADHPGVPMLVLSMFAQEQYALRAFRAGAKGYVTKDTAARELVTAVRKVAAGGAYIPSSVAESFVLQLQGDLDSPRHDKLSDRELDVLRRLVSGERLTDIADALHLSVKTVSTHKSRILQKLQLPSLAALVRYGLQQGLVDDISAGADHPRHEP